MSSISTIRFKRKKVTHMPLLKIGTKAYSILKMKCPRCQEGDLFETSTFSFSKPFYMPERCPVCGQDYFPEPGFYYGAMFISYIITGWFAIILVGLLILVFGLYWLTAFWIMVAAMALLFVWFFRIARSIWISANVKYDERALEKVKR